MFCFKNYKKIYRVFLNHNITAVLKTYLRHIGILQHQLIQNRNHCSAADLFIIGILAGFLLFSNPTIIKDRICGGKKNLKKLASRNDEQIRESHEQQRYSPIPMRCRGLCWGNLSHQTHYTCSALQNLLPFRWRIVDVCKSHNQKPQATAEKHFCLSLVTHTYPQHITGPFLSNFIISTKKQGMKLKSKV